MAFRPLKVILLEFFSMNHGADFLAPSAVHALLTVDVGIPESLDVGGEGDGGMGAGIAAGVAAATLFLTSYFYHKNVVIV